MLNRFVGTSFGSQQRINRGVEEALVAYRRKEAERLGRDMTPKDITLTQDETRTGGLCLVAIEPVSNYILLEQMAEARDHDTWSELRSSALAPLKCNVIQSTATRRRGFWRMSNIISGRITRPTYSMCSMNSSGLSRLQWLSNNTSHTPYCQKSTRRANLSA